MKNKRKIKLLTLVLSLALLIGSALCLAVGAESGDESVDIVAANIIYGDRVQLAFAVDTELENAANVNLYYYVGTPVQGAEPKVATLLDGKTYTEGGVAYPIYVTEGIAAKDIGDKVYAYATEGSAQAPEDAYYLVYSVAEYLYARLYKDGYVAKTVYDGKEYNRKRLYELLLEYGAQAQTVLVNDVSGKTETLVTDYVYVSVVGGTIGDNGRSTALYEGATEITLTAPAGKEGTWQMTTYTAGIATTEILFSNVVKVTKSCVITYGTGLTQPDDPSNGVAKPQAPAWAQIHDFEGSYSEVEKQLSYTDGTVSSVTELVFSDGTKVTYSASTNVQEAVASVVTENLNSYLNVSSPKRVHSNDRGFSVSTALSYTAMGYTAYVFEADLMIGSTLNGEKTAKTVEIMMRPSADSKVYLQYNMAANANGILSMGGVSIAKCDEWFTLRLEFVPANNEIRAYVKNDLGFYEYRGSLGAPSSGSTTKDFAAIESKAGYVSLNTYNNKTEGTSVSIDNTTLYAAKIDYEFEEIVIPPSDPVQ